MLGKEKDDCAARAVGGAAEDAPDKIRNLGTAGAMSCAV
jgi:hypothetical protein